jgi:hypothetical protein
MKKALILPLLVGMAWVCYASPVAFSNQGIAVEACLSIDDATLNQVFEEAVPLFASQYGVEVSVAGLQNGYANGTVTVEYLGEGNYRVTQGGNPVITVLDDFL